MQELPEPSKALLLGVLAAGPMGADPMERARLCLVRVDGGIATFPVSV